VVIPTADVGERQFYACALIKRAICCRFSPSAPRGYSAPGV
jgi:hypothetical protein